MVCSETDLLLRYRIAAALVANILFDSALITELSSAEDVLPARYSNEMAALNEREADPFLDGEYKIILQLVGVMQVRQSLLYAVNRCILG